MSKYLKINDEKLLNECGVNEFEPFMEACQQLFSLLAEANNKHNLTTITDAEDFWIKHVIDSLLIGSYFPELSHKELKV